MAATSRPTLTSLRVGPSRWEKYYAVVRRIPRGRIATYAQVALLAGTPRAARQVGRVLYFYARAAKVPWQRVINHYGGISTYKIGTGELQRALLEDEGVDFRQDGSLDLERYQWRPKQSTIDKLKLPDEIAMRVSEKLPFSKG